MYKNVNILKTVWNYSNLGLDRKLVSSWMAIQTCNEMIKQMHGNRYLSIFMYTHNIQCTFSKEALNKIIH